MSASVGVDPEKAFHRLSVLVGQQLGAHLAEVAMRDAALEAAHARIAELEKNDTVAEP